MGIRLKEHAETESFDLGIAGAVTAITLPTNILAPFALVLKGVYAFLNTAGGTQATIVDIQKAAAGGAFASVFSGATKINFAISSQTPTFGALTNPLVTFNKGDMLRFVVTQVGSAPAPADLGLAVLLQRPKYSGVSAATQFGTVDIQAE
jgi:hypothetical protein